MKCTLFDEQGDGTFEKVACSEVVASPDQAGDACAHDACGQDTCDAGLACAPASQGGGVCRSLCHEIEDPCDDAASVCVEVLGPVGLCRAGCQLLLQDCADEEGCFLQVAGDEVSCAPANPDNVAGAACDSYNDCAIGYQCIAGDTVGGCPDDAPSCCTSLCEEARGVATCALNEACLGLDVPDQGSAGVCIVPV